MVKQSKNSLNNNKKKNLTFSRKCKQQMQHPFCLPRPLYRTSTYAYMFVLVFVTLCFCQFYVQYEYNFHIVWNFFSFFFFWFTWIICNIIHYLFNACTGTTTFEVASLHTHPQTHTQTRPRTHPHSLVSFVYGTLRNTFDFNNRKQMGESKIKLIFDTLADGSMATLYVYMYVDYDPH